MREVYTPLAEPNGKEPALVDGNSFSFRRGDQLERDDNKTVSEEKNGVIIRQWFWLFNGIRAGYVPYNPLDSKDTRSPAIELTDDIPPPFQMQLFEKTIPVVLFVENCVRKAIRWEANGAYLFALAFLESGDRWPKDQVSSPEGTTTVGTYGFLPQTWRTLVDKLGTEQNIGMQDIGFPEPQTTFAASQAGDAATELKSRLGQPPTFHQLYLAHLFTIEGCVAISKLSSTELETPFDEVLEGIIQKIDETTVKARVTSLIERKKSILANGGKPVTAGVGILALNAELDRGFAEVKRVATDLITPQVSASSPSQVQPGGQSTLGVLSEEFESNGDPGRIGWDRVGGWSYGKYQISAAKGVFADFMRFLISGPYSGIGKTLNDGGGAKAAKKGDEGFRNLFTSLKANPEFSQAQYDFIKISHYDPMVDRLRKTLDVASSSIAIQNVVWSVAVQFGPKSGIVKIAADLVGTTSDLNLINAIYDERSKVNLYFPNSTQDVRDSVLKRFKRERAVAIRMLG
ncbi:hypothetical protein ELG83_24695 (plasmid) [Rhizobium leguminosarum]|uniref:Type VI secretion system spike protein VgrG3-like C-terminal domain-containing protein n=1 Tax=Rhizobium leguminosarum bv. viciae TaxID=387 RepID=A0A8I2GZ45_RHILV|nr:hypothetical protein [Rhizobium leguminosarum]NKM48797.1 hypothetical protein [Rhizobium leguminosarum bv. viciae]TBF88041.1 hypothetical protein ELG83_24695 [Rhizobium leguminosarum]